MIFHSACIRPQAPQTWRTSWDYGHNVARALNRAPENVRNASIYDCIIDEVPSLHVIQSVYHEINPVKQLFDVMRAYCHGNRLDLDF